MLKLRRYIHTAAHFRSIVTEIQCLHVVAVDVPIFVNDAEISKQRVDPALSPAYVRFDVYSLAGTVVIYNAEIKILQFFVPCR